jgi:glycosyltransferase involved in cell wall biosynthesis
VGNVYPHKNPERLVLAFQKIRKSDPNVRLVFVGAEDYFYARLKKLVAGKKIKNIVFAGFAPDHDLDVLFHNALAYVRPSLYEGFELPPLEAMAKGVPVLSSSHECALEILGDSACYFDGENVEDIARVMKLISYDEELRNSLVERGYAQVKKYSWKSMAIKTMEIYKSASLI